MAITTIILSSKFIETVEKVIYEWLIDTDCFGTPGTLVEKVAAYILQDAEADDMKLPWCEYLVSVVSTEGTGAGALGTESRFKHISVEIGLRAKRPSNDYDLVVLGDKLDNFFRHATKGRPALGTAGIRKAELDGPLPDDSDKYYLRRFFLTGRVRVSNEVA